MKTDVHTKAGSIQCAADVAAATTATAAAARDQIRIVWQIDLQINSDQTCQLGSNERCRSLVSTIDPTPKSRRDEEFAFALILLERLAAPANERLSLAPDFDRTMKAFDAEPRRA